MCFLVDRTAAVPQNRIAYKVVMEFEEGALMSLYTPAARSTRDGNKGDYFNYELGATYKSPPGPAQVKYVFDSHWYSSVGMYVFLNLQDALWHRPDIRVQILRVAVHPDNFLVRAVNNPDSFHNYKSAATYSKIKVLSVVPTRWDGLKGRIRCKPLQADYKGM